jgi:hypothetical protein
MACVNFTTTMPTRLLGVYHPVPGRLPSSSYHEKELFYPISNNHLRVNKHHTSTRLAYFHLSIGFPKAYCHHGHHTTGFEDGETVSLVSMILAKHAPLLSMTPVKHAFLVLATSVKNALALSMTPASFILIWVGNNL